MSDTTSARPWRRPEEPKGTAAHLTQLKDMVVAYAKQETIDPLKTLGRYMGFGVAGAMFLGLGLFLLLLALLRGLQQIDLFVDPMAPEGGTWSWVPYTITTVVGALVAGLFLKKLMSAMNKRGTR